MKSRLRLEASGENPNAIALISSYETYCRLHPDVAHERSFLDDDDEAVDEIRSLLIESFLPELLERIETWAGAEDQDELVDAVGEAKEYLETAQAELGYV